jgi:geranylgeranyl pyrophosphate synthase
MRLVQRFRWPDEFLNVEANELALGKPAGKDASRNKATLVAALGIDEARERRDKLLALQRPIENCWNATITSSPPTARWNL